MQLLRYTVVFTCLFVGWSTFGVDVALAYQNCGRASWYSMPNSRTASGERMNPGAMTAAHRSLPIGSRVVVKNMRNGRRVSVRINDRGPFVRGRIIDVSRAAAARLGFVSSGTTKVCIAR